MDHKAAAAVWEALRFDRSTPIVLSDERWAGALAYCDRYQLTLPLARVARDCPPAVRERFHQNAAANRLRHAGLMELYRSLVETEHVVLKGFTHWPYFCPDPELRTQYDLDLYCPREAVFVARDAALQLGFEPLGEMERFPTDHLPAMIRKTGWQWRGDFFDTEIPFSLELHFRFWDRGTERFGPLDLEGFWERREQRQWRDVPFWSLCEADALAYACLHALRHLLRGDPRPAQFYEIGWFLHRQQDAAFWEKWNALHDDSLRRIQAICFRFAESWFGCGVAPGAREEVDRLPDDVQAWFRKWAWSPLETPFRANKDELWLHLCLLDSFRDKTAVLRRRLIPLKPPGPVSDVHLADKDVTVTVRARKALRYVQFTSERAAHHALALLPAVATGLHWWIERRELTAEFWRFFRAAVIFNSSLMLFYLLYNLHLVNLGFKEDFIGKVTAFMTAGSIVGSITAGLVAARIGLRVALMFAFAATGVVSALRVLAMTPVPLLALAFVGGMCQSIWAVCLAPTVASLTSERNRAFAFSAIFSMGVSLGMVTGVVGGRLPALFHSTQNALWFGCILAPLAVFPLFRLKLRTPPGLGLRTFAVNPFLLRFLGALSLWSIATGAFNPFFNVYFSRVMHLPVEQIGVIFTAAHVAQVCAMLLSPLVLKRFGLLPGIAMMQAATGLALAALGVTTPALAGLLYALYTAFQYMSEPGIFSLLMSGVPEEKRTGASALNFVMLFGTHAIAAWAAGAAITQFGYPPVLFAAALLTWIAARAITLVTRS